MTNLLLLSEQVMDLEIVDLGKHRALWERDTSSGESAQASARREVGSETHLHDRSSLVVLDVSNPVRLVEGDVLGEALETGTEKDQA